MKFRRITIGERVFFLALYYFMLEVLFIVGTRFLFERINASRHLSGLTTLDWFSVPFLTATFILSLAYMLKRVMNTFVEASA